jgi:hypothetical protein
MLLSPMQILFGARTDSRMLSEALRPIGAPVIYPLDLLYQHRKWLGFPVMLKVADLAA